MVIPDFLMCRIKTGTFSCQHVLTEIFQQTVYQITFFYNFHNKFMKSPGIFEFRDSISVSPHPISSYIPWNSIIKYQMKLIHIADTQLGLAAFNRLDPGSGMNLREKQVYNNF